MDNSVSVVLEAGMEILPEEAECSVSSTQIAEVFTSTYTYIKIHRR